MNKLQIKIAYTGKDFWEPKYQGCIFVRNQKDKNKLFKLLVEQDEYWKTYKKLIKILPDETIQNIGELDKYCEYVGKTDIFDVKHLKEQVDFIIHQPTKIIL